MAFIILAPKYFVIYSINLPNQVMRRVRGSEVMSMEFRTQNSMNLSCERLSIAWTKLTQGKGKKLTY
jgi:hypothetical protein